jgi:hypothetical protein
MIKRANYLACLTLIENNSSNMLNKLSFVHPLLGFLFQ